MSPHQQQYYQHVLATLDQVFLTQSAEVEQAAALFAECVKANGIIHGFGSGHSFAAAVELAGRAGGLVNTKAIDQFYGPTGWFDSLKGIGDIFSGLLDLREADCFVIISNSGTKPLHVELARKVKEMGLKLVVITRYTGESVSTSESICDYADVILDNGCPAGDCTLSMDNGNIMTGPVSSLSAAFIINNVVIRCIEMLLEQGIAPPVMRSINLAGGKEYNDALMSQYKERVFTL
ncbi:TPA: sugar isomerase domain-containing protein [Klebsiella aerogenes]|uniref:Sugar isomerase domain-containing protein n=1 Tax=Klebsiella aerogenes TaxID=548 RepID=A0A837JNP5_KLEAE|nr:sugar isomerase domain-containing protein [Klebsiella aerogenes]EKM7810885.1 sugar isomerase domain-containing protein [Klebsiella aerogenes]EKU6607746.1 sugar isomerase domain-containing protein [Klebsiella aerogenes]EKU7552539.1 sugar isomerase domain-containing protein [Klebsiella aerogenes]EKW5857025.1 sugar isomerase domain-containing protein [Klebsiella aerogenes]EKW8536313.1 sugar isomerase domain-containing protein [Klebsiella aerogenes]